MKYTLRAARLIEAATTIMIVSDISIDDLPSVIEYLESTNPENMRHDPNDAVLCDALIAYFRSKLPIEAK
jgi:hypothetical protein